MKKEIVDQTFAVADDATVCNEVCSAIESHYGYDEVVWSVDGVPYECRVIHYVWATRGFLAVNGYRYFWGIHIDHHFFVEALEAIGDVWQAENVRDSLKVIDAHSILGDYQKVTGYFGTEDLEKEAAEPFESKLYSGKADTQKFLSIYIRRHRHSFPEVHSKATRLINKEIKSLYCNIDDQS